jgi:hypothetical protein
MQIIIAVIGFQEVHDGLGCLSAHTRGVDHQLPITGSAVQKLHRQ